MSKKIWSYIISVLCILAGIYFIINPKESFSSIVYYLGIILLVVGVLKIISAFVDKNSYSPSIRVFSGLVNMLFGVILVSNPEMTVKLVTVFLGIYLILTSISNLLLLFSMSKSGVVNNELIVQAILKLILGIIVFTTPIISIIFTGAVIGVLLIVCGIYTIIKTSKKEVTYKVKVKWVKLM